VAKVCAAKVFGCAQPWNCVCTVRKLRVHYRVLHSISGRKYFANLRNFRMYHKYFEFLSTYRGLIHFVSGQTQLHLQSHPSKVLRETLGFTSVSLIRFVFAYISLAMFPIQCNYLAEYLWVYFLFCQLFVLTKFLSCWLSVSYSYKWENFWIYLQLFIE